MSQKCITEGTDSPCQAGSPETRGTAVGPSHEDTAQGFHGDTNKLTLIVTRGMLSLLGAVLYFSSVVQTHWQLPPTVFALPEDMW